MWSFAVFSGIQWIACRSTAVSAELLVISQLADFAV